MEKNLKPERPKDSDGNDSLKGGTAESLGTAPMMMTADEIATCLGISSRTVWRLKAKGDLPKSVKIGRAVRWRKSVILEWIDLGCPATDPLINCFPTFTQRPTEAEHLNNQRSDVVTSHG